MKVDQTMAKKKKERSWRFNYLGIFIVLTVILVTLSAIEIQQYFASKNRYASLDTEYQSLKLKKDGLKPDIEDIVSGKFDLRAKERQLDKNYTILAKALFGEAKSADAVISQTDIYTRYFSKKGWNTLSQLAIVNQDRFIASSNSYVKINFSNLNLYKKTIDITIFSKFDLNKSTVNNDADYGVAYIKVVYDLQNDKAVKSMAIVSYPQPDND